MKYINSVKTFFDKGTEEEKIIKRQARDLGISNFTVNKDLTVDVDGSVDCSHRSLTKFPFKFGRVMGGFDCSSNQLTTLEGAPKFVLMEFIAIGNQLTNLIGGPVRVNGRYDVTFNHLGSLEGIKYLGDDRPGQLKIHSNRLTTLEFLPYQWWNCEMQILGNPINQLANCIGLKLGEDSHNKFIREFLDLNDTYKFLKGNKLNELRFKSLLEDNRDTDDIRIVQQKIRFSDQVSLHVIVSGQVYKLTHYELG